MTTEHTVVMVRRLGDLEARCQNCTWRDSAFAPLSAEADLGLLETIVLASARRHVATTNKGNNDG